MNPLRVLIVDDEPPIRRFLKTALSAQDYRVEEAGDGEAALDFLKRNPVDLVVLDLGLPGMDGLEVLRRLRGQGIAIPVIILSSRDDEAGKVAALDLGADDYVSKPFGVEELSARIRAALRHRLQQEGEKPLFKSGDLTVDLVRRIVTARGTDVKLTPREYDLLRLLIAHAGKVLTHKLILKEVWGGETDVQYLRIYIRTLRQKREADPECPVLILTGQAPAIGRPRRNGPENKEFFPKNAFARARASRSIRDAGISSGLHVPAISHPGLDCAPAGAGASLRRRPPVASCPLGGGSRSPHRLPGRRKFRARYLGK